ncbi:hypothetical protein HYH02_012429 [Chlamydomonas schloesseri]|uniref:Peptidase C1A papain C-terminal domain-containing protein n=1 Tax=Chlamydomonas schloesseri TaxID=2026947 RepID=A0A835SYT9_9CHLO|nr:hypothetical protein HYH02_012429 [Chlamydomonas schloesseri]|eukprot:KAG2433967.1 hypothetical protein HYH02_012429 [Chlamydomonas schloesseri]
MEPCFSAQCGACYAYAVVHAIAALHSIRGGTSSGLVELAVLQAALCNADKTTPGCKGGWVAETYQYAIKSGILEADAWADMVAGADAEQCPQSAVESELAKLLYTETPDAWIVQNSWGTGWGEGGYMRLPRDDTLLGRNPCGLLNSATYPVVDKVTPERRGDLVQEAFCSGMGLVSSSGGGGRTVRQLVEYHGVSLNDFLRINTHIALMALLEAPPAPMTWAGLRAGG